MKRGTKVGQAYVAITADGSGINKDIVDSVDAAGGDIGDSGDRAGQDYGDRFGDSLSEHLGPIMEKMGDDLSKRLSRSVSDGLNKTVNNEKSNGLGARLGDNIGAALSDRLERHLVEFLDTVDTKLQAVSGNGGGSGSGGSGGGSGTSGPAAPGSFPPPDRDSRVWFAAHRMDLEFDRRRGLMLDAARKMDESFARARGLMVERAMKLDEKFDRARGLMVERAIDMNEKYDRAQGLMVERANKMNESFDRAQVRMLESAERMNEKYDKDRGLLVDRAYRDNEKFDQSRGRMLETADRMNGDYDRARHKMIRSAYEQNDKFDRSRTVMLAQAHRMNMLHSRGKIDGAGYSVPGNGSSGSDNSSIADKFGGLFGKGSRNNFLNIIGSAMASVVGLFEKGIKGVGSFVTTFQQGMTQAGEGASFLQKMMGGASLSGSKMMTSLAASGPGAIAAIVAVTLAASVLVSVLSAVLAIVVALASTIVSALVGAAAVGAAGLLAMVAAGGLLTAAFMSMTNAQKDVLKTSFAPLRSEMVGIGQIMLTQMVPAFATWSANLQKALYLVVPVAQVMGSAFAKAGSTLTAAFSGPGFQAMATALGTWLPSIVKRLSVAFGAFLNGAMGLFAAMMPMVNRFAGYLANVATKFSNWANSAKGRHAIVEFVDRAVASLKSLWGFTKQVFGFISDLLFSPAAQNAGNSMFDSMKEAFKDFRRELKKVIDNGKLQEWFEKGKKFGEALWDVIKSIGDIFAWLDSSKTIDGVALSLKTMAGSMKLALDGADAYIDMLYKIADGLGFVDSSARIAAQGLATTANQIDGSAALSQLLLGPMGGDQNGMPATATTPSAPTSTLPSLAETIASGLTAQDHTFQADGGNIPDPVKPDYKNPYTQWAQQFIDQGPSMAQQVKDAIKEVNAQFQSAIRQAAKAGTLGEARSLIAASIESAKSVGDSMVESAQGALSSAAQTLASASSPEDAARALKALTRMQKNLAAAVAMQGRIEEAMARLGKQKVVTGSNVTKLLNGKTVENATLADYAAARARLAVQIEKANQKLVDAIALRNDYRTGVVDATKSFGNLLTAQAKSINGVEQALTHTDITTNLRDRLAKIREFQANLRQLLALGLSNDAYKQLVDGGVEQGGAFAAALVAGGSGAVSEVNGLTSQISDVAKALGVETSNRLYQAGVAAAQGLVDGLNSMSTQLDSAATRLGNAIANAIKKALGIKSPSTVMFAAMGNVGDGIVGGLDAQHVKVNSAAARLSSQVAVSPEVASWAARNGTAPVVSGNGSSTVHEWHITTPTTDPVGVAREAINEMTGRL